MSRVFILELDCGIHLPSSRREIMLSMFMMSDMFRCCAAAANFVVVAVDDDNSACLRCLICLPDFSASLCIFGIRYVCYFIDVSVFVRVLRRGGRVGGKLVRVCV